MIIAGEASGDLHGSHLVKELWKLDPAGIFCGWGGDLMQQAGVKLLSHYRDMAFMGFIEVLAHLGKIRNIFRTARKELVLFRPDVLILIDYPGFNLWMARYAKKQGIRVCYYISPKVWAWKSSRVKKIKKYVDRMFVIFPFEEEYYKKYGYRVYYEGNPLIDSISHFEENVVSREEFLKRNGLDNRPLIGVIPGSRIQEIKRNLPAMLKMTDYYPEFQFLVAGFPAIDRDLYANIIGHRKVHLLFDQTREIMKFSRAAMVTSGTATLETALLKTPQVVCYRAHPFSYLMARMLVKTKYISLVNLIMQRTVVTELIQGDLNPERLKKELDLLLYDNGTIRRILDDYETLDSMLGEPGVSQRIAAGIVLFAT